MPTLPFNTSDLELAKGGTDFSTQTIGQDSVPSPTRTDDTARQRSLGVGSGTTLATAPGNGAVNGTPRLGSNAREYTPPNPIFGTPPVGIIGRHKPRAVVRVDRDYSFGEAPQFWGGWLWELEGRVEPREFAKAMDELNSILASAHDPRKSVFDNCLAIFSLYISTFLMTSHFSRELDRFEKARERTNKEVFNPHGLHILSPRRTAFLFLEIEYY